jgi:predicted peroxiredoxin
MNPISKFVTALSVCALAACATPLGDAALPAAPQVPTQTETLLAVMTSADPQTQLMTLVLTRSAREAGETPRILLCSAGGDLALAAPPLSATSPLKPRGVSPQGALKALMSEGVKVEVCAIYLPNRGVGRDALIDGVGVAKPAEIGQLIAAPGVQILSF